MNFRTSHKANLIKALLICLVAACVLLFARSVDADLRANWWDPDGVGNGYDWHYRVPLNIFATATIDSTIRVDVDFNALLASMGVSGTFDLDSPRIVRNTNALATKQQYSPLVYSGATDIGNPNRGEIRFLLEDQGSNITYYLYFDIVENSPIPGDKDPLPASYLINGSFEFSTDGQEDPPGWTGTPSPSIPADGQAMAIFDAFNYPVTDSSRSVTTNEVARTGQFNYLLGPRDVNEPSNGSAPSGQTASLSRTIDVPSSNPGVLQFNYRVKGWDSSTNGASQWDYLRIFLQDGGAVQELVGPATGNYTSNPFSPNFGLGQAARWNSGYGQYNGWDTDTRGRHRSGMSDPPFTRGAEPWIPITVNLAPYAGRTVTLQFESYNINLYKSWFHVDDVEWSLVNVTIAANSAEAFGVNIIAPDDITAPPYKLYSANITLAIQAQVDARPSVSGAPITADLIDSGSSVVASAIPLYDDGSHGDATANDNVWTNDGSVLSEPTYTFNSGDLGNWTVRVYARDASTSTVGAPDGLVHIPTAPNTPVSQANYYNVDDQIITLIEPPDIDMTKTMETIYDPVNSGSNPKAIPGSIIEYTVEITNTAGATQAENIVLTDDLTALVTPQAPATQPHMVFEVDGYAAGQGMRIRYDTGTGYGSWTNVTNIDSDTDGDWNATAANTVTVDCGDLDVGHSVQVQYRLSVRY